MQECLLREVWAASGNDFLLPPSPRAELGNIAHRILEAVGRGELKGTGSEEVNERWEFLVSEAEARMAHSPLRRQQTPLSQSIPDFHVLRLRTCNKAVEIARDVHRCSGKLPKLSRCATGFELWVESDDGDLGGFIDRASETTEGVVLSDYKSGAVLETGPEKYSRELKHVYRIQMQLYAALYRQRTETLPVRLEVIPLQGEPIEVVFELEHVERLLLDAKEFLRVANNRIDAVQDGTMDTTVLAVAIPEYCRLCLFRPACGAYWDARQREIDARWPADVRGILEKSTLLRNGKLCLLIRQTDSPSLSSIVVRGVTDSADRHPILTSMPLGAHVAVYGLQRDYRSCDYIETQNTVIYRTD